MWATVILLWTDFQLLSKTTPKIHWQTQEFYVYKTMWCVFRCFPYFVSMLTLATLLLLGRVRIACASLAWHCQEIKVGSKSSDQSFETEESRTCETSYKQQRCGNWTY